MKTYTFFVGFVDDFFGTFERRTFNIPAGSPALAQAEFFMIVPGRIQNNKTFKWGLSPFY
jgi:hypothetical protein